MALTALLFVGIAALFGSAWWVASLGPVPLGKDLRFSATVLDRDGRLLRAYATEDGRWRLPAHVADVDPRFFDVLFAYEDKRFRTHRGVDPLALTRGVLQLIASGHVRSGGSTLTMQVARLLEPRANRTLAAKLRQIVRAIELERALSKDDILSLYLELAPYGGNIEGIRAASLAYFGKEPRRLTLGQAALLVALPQAPELRRPDRAPELARIARNRVLDRFAATGAVSTEDITLAKSEPVPTARRPMPLLAPHTADRVISETPGAREIRLTIDAELQKKLEELARDRVQSLAQTLGPNTSLALLVVDNASGEVLARVGSPAYFDERRAGQVDMTQALRSPGSTLKPFIYGLGFEDGFIHPQTLIEDRAERYGGYAPRDFNFTFAGTVTVAQALQQSLNMPAIAVLDRVGASRLTARLAQAGAALVLPDGQAPGLAIGLGGVGTKLSDLVMLYAGLARFGTVLPLRERLDAPAPQARRLLAAVPAWYVANVLLGAPPPENGVAGRIAFKTGTSYGYRDAWSVGFDGRHTIGVWVGRPDGAPVPGLVGREAAAPILFDAFARLGPPAALPRPPAGVLMTSNAKLPPPLRHFRPGLGGGGSQASLHILFPPNGALLDLSTTDGRPDPVPLKLTGAVAPLTVFVNGVPVSPQQRGNAFFTPNGPGFSRVTVIDGAGATDSVVVRIGRARPPYRSSGLPVAKRDERGRTPPSLAILPRHPRFHYGPRAMKPLKDARMSTSLSGRDVPLNLIRWCLALARRPRAPTPPFPTSAYAGIVVMLGAVIAAMFLLDVPAVAWARHLPRGLVEVFEQITNAGLSGWYLIPSGAIVVLLAALASPALPRLPWGVLTALAARFGFFFLAVGVPGLVTTLIKHLLGRARPYMEPAGHPFTFVPFNSDSNYASLPSGHGTTAASVAFAIGALWPRTRPFMWLYVLTIMFSRIVLMSHHPSDVIAGVLVGTLFAALVRRWFAARRLVFSPRTLAAYSGPSLRRVRMAMKQVFSS